MGCRGEELGCCGNRLTLFSSYLVYLILVNTREKHLSWRCGSLSWWFCLLSVCLSFCQSAWPSLSWEKILAHSYSIPGCVVCLYITALLWNRQLLIFSSTSVLILVDLLLFFEFTPKEFPTLHISYSKQWVISCLNSYFFVWRGNNVWLNVLLVLLRFCCILDFNFALWMIECYSLSHILFQ